MNTSADKIARNITSLMLRSGIRSEAELARISGLNQPTVHRIMKGESRDPKLSNLKALAKAFSVPYWQLTEMDSETGNMGGEPEAIYEVGRAEFLNPSQIKLLQDCMTFVIDTKNLLGFDLSEKAVAKAAAGCFNHCMKRGINPAQMSDDIRDTVLSAAAGSDM